MANYFRPTIGAVIALSIAFAPIPALAAGFTPEYKQRWLDTAHALIAATTSEVEDMDAPCKGISLLGMPMEVRKEYFQAPRWAFNAHIQTCLAFHTIAKGGKGFMRMNSGDACKGIKAAVGELGKAKVGVDPDDVVAVAGELRTALISLAADFKDAKACKFG